MIRYVDSSGWTWEVCELADRLGTVEPAEAAPAAAAASTMPTAAPHRADGRLAPATGLADASSADDVGSADDASAGQLYFFSRVGTRKLRGYPPSWSQLPRAELEALCDAAVDVGG